MRRASSLVSSFAADLSNRLAWRGSSEFQAALTGGKYIP
jgi:hypothetical protein